ncbi:MAG: AmmeMemoRadiSam system protein B, partial [Acidimicrobiia bacterium]|nr:AmmeMemoRadiSam system protein B [Acidimicrobiia bacterium]
FDGLASPDHDALATPLGLIASDPLLAHLERDGYVRRSEPAHEREHSLEVQLPFLQVMIPNFTVAAVLTGDDDPGPAARAIATMLDAGLFVVVSSDLSHYHDHRTAGRLDRETARVIVELRESDLGRHSACGRTAVRGALRVAAERGWQCELLDLRTSGDTAGSKDRVVGYGAFVLGALLEPAA